MGEVAKDFLATNDEGHDLHGSLAFSTCSNVDIKSPGKTLRKARVGKKVRWDSDMAPNLSFGFDKFHDILSPTVRSRENTEVQALVLHGWGDQRVQARHEF